MSLVSCPRVLVGATLIDGTGAEPVQNSVIIIEDEYITAVGKQGEIDIPQGSEVYNLTGMTVTPGLIDSHCHFQRMGVDMKVKTQLNDTKSLSEALLRVKHKVKQTKPGEWVLGKGYDEAKWPENRYINKYDLDKWSPDNPVVLTRICGHLVSANSMAMELAGISKDTPKPDGGQIDRDENGEPTGVFRDCSYLLYRIIPPYTEEMLADGILTASNFALSLGCTGVHDAGVGPVGIRGYQQANRDGRLKVRAYTMIVRNSHQSAYGAGLMTGFGDPMLRIGSMKLLLDGSLGARTAALFEPYEDEPSTKGLLLEDPEVMTELVKAAHVNGSQAAIHAIGDLAIEHAINCIQEAVRVNPRKDHRHRIEHCEILSSQQIERIRQLGIVPDMQPNFIGEWSGPGSMYNQRLGDKRERMSNPYRYMLDEGIPIAFGSDGMPFSPIYGLWSAVNHPIKHNRITLHEAVKCYSLNAAYASFQEDYVGSVEPGKLADIAVFDRDLTEIPIGEIKDAECYMTLVNGKILYHKEN